MNAYAYNNSEKLMKKFKVIETDFGKMNEWEFDSLELAYSFLKRRFGKESFKRMSDQVDKFIDKNKRIISIEKIEI